MKGPLKHLFFIYQWFVVLPIAIALTVLTALSTIILAYIVKSPIVRAWPARIWSKAICFLSFVKVDVKGGHHINPNTSYVFVSNHQSAFDIWLIYGWLDMPFSWIMKQELRKIPLVGLACEKIGHIFVDRTNPKAAKRSIDKAEQVLQNGQCVVVFPEGTRTKTGAVNAFKRGAFKMASDLQLPIVPLCIEGSFGRISSKSLLVKPGRMRLTIHEPIAVETKLSELEIKNLAQEVREVIINNMNA